MAKPKTKTCPTCNGAGKLPVTGAYGDTYDLLAKQRKEISGADLARIAKCKPAAMSNRLVVLERYGLATSRVDGRQRLYKATK